MAGSLVSDKIKNVFQKLVFWQSNKIYTTNGDATADVEITTIANNLNLTGTITGLTGSDVGLGNVDNTADSAKPVSSATQSALNAKENTITRTDLTNVTSSSTVASATAVKAAYDRAWQAAGSYITGSGSLSAQDLTDIGNLSGVNSGDQDISGITTNASNIATNTSNISSNDTDIANNATNIASNASNIATNTTNIGTKLPLAGGIMTGSLTLNGDPTNVNHSSTKKYVDNLIQTHYFGVSEITTTGGYHHLMNSGIMNASPVAGTATAMGNGVDPALTLDYSAIADESVEDIVAGYWIVPADIAVDSIRGCATTSGTNASETVRFHVVKYDLSTTTGDLSNGSIVGSSADLTGVDGSALKTTGTFSIGIGAKQVDALQVLLATAEVSNGTSGGDKFTAKVWVNYTYRR